MVDCTTGNLWTQNCHFMWFLDLFSSLAVVPMMPCNYQRKKGARTYSDYEEETVEKALKDIQENKTSLKKASKMYKIPHITLYRRVSTVPRL